MYCFFFFFNDTATTEIYTLSLHDALPISLRAIDDRRSEDRVRQPRCADQLFGVPLRTIIRGRSRLVPRADRAHVHESLDTRPARRLDHSPGAFHVYGVKGRRTHFDDDADQVYDGVRAPHQGRERARVGHIARDELDPEALERRRPARVAHQRSDRMSATRQHGGDVPSDEPGRTGDGDQHEATDQVEAVPPSSRNTSVRRRATTEASASKTLGSSTVPERSAARCTAFSGLIFSW